PPEGRRAGVQGAHQDGVPAGILHLPVDLRRHRRAGSSADQGHALRTMRIVVPDAGMVLAEQATEARSYWARFRGLMLRRRLEPGGGLIIEPCSSIHMMWMRFPIDAVFYDREHRVT